MSTLGQGSGIWGMMCFGSYAISVLLGVYGRKRSDFSNDFSYNKYHFGVFVNLAAGTGLYLSAKVPHPYHSSLLFLGSICLNSIPAYSEGFQDMKNQETKTDTALLRKVGFYMLLAGYGVIMYKHKKIV